MTTALSTFTPAAAPRPRRPALPGPTPLPATSTPGRRHLTRLVVLLTEALAGRRPAHQLAPILTYPAQTALRVLPRQPHNLRVHSVHLRPLDRTTVEVAATLVTPTRAKALAARLEHTGTGWRFTALHVVGR